MTRIHAQRSSAAFLVAALALVGGLTLAPVPAWADEAGSPGFADSVLEKLQLKAKPADPAPDFVRKTRPDAARLDYIQRPVPHKVSPLPTKSADEVQAMKDALDAARERQLNPPPPTSIAPSATAKKKGAKAKPPT